MNNKAVRVPSYATYHTKNGTIRIVVELSARQSDKSKCATMDHDCSEHVAHEVISHYWTSYDGQMPLEIPKCGFDGNLCDYTLIFILCGLAAFAGIASPLGYFLYKRE